MGKHFETKYMEYCPKYGEMPSPHSSQIARKKQGFCVFPRYPAYFRSDSGGILQGIGVIVILGRFRGAVCHNGETFGYYRACCQQYLEPAEAVRVHCVPFLVRAIHLMPEVDLEDERDVRVD